MALDQASTSALTAVFAPASPSCRGPLGARSSQRSSMRATIEQLPARRAELVLERPGEAVSPPPLDRLQPLEAPELGAQRRLRRHAGRSLQIALPLRAIGERPQRKGVERRREQNEGLRPGAPPSPAPMSRVLSQQRI